MFKKLRNRIIIITMTTTTAVLILAGGFIMLFSSSMRPEPKPRPEYSYDTLGQELQSEQQLQEFIKNDRKEGNERLLITLFCVGVAIEIAVFLITYFASQKMVEPVKDSYDKQKLFIANASHELKTPLAIIGANVEAMDVDKKNAKWKGNIEDEVEHASKLVLDLLQLARMDAESTSLSTPEEIEVTKEIRKRIKMFQPKFASGKISFKPDAEPVNMILPKQDFLQVLDILLDNATKYGDKKVQITLNEKRVEVSNDGVKISKEEQKKVFDRFYQADKTKSGSGLGLAILKALCKQNGWRVYCKGSEKLTTFVVEFGK